MTGARRTSPGFLTTISTIYGVLALAPEQPTNERELDPLVGCRPFVLRLGEVAIKAPTYEHWLSSVVSRANVAPSCLETLPE